MPNTYEGTFSVNGIRTTERVVANDQTSAKKLMEMRLMIKQVLKN